MLVSAIVLSFNAQDHIKPCVEELVAAFAGLTGPCEVLVVENGSKDDSPEILRQLEQVYPDVLQVEYKEENCGTTKSRNSAIRKAEGDFILILDADARASNHVLRHLLEVLEENPECGIAVPRLTYENGDFQLSVDDFPTVQRKLQRALGLKKIESHSGLQDATGLREVDYAISAFWLVRRAVFDKVGLLDERIFYSPEDVDFCLRVWKQGWKILYSPKESAIHIAQELSRGLQLNQFKVRHIKGLAYLFFKHRYIFFPPKFRQ